HPLMTEREKQIVRLALVYLSTEIANVVAKSPSIPPGMITFDGKDMEIPADVEIQNLLVEFQ
ncbi:hypothetical protein NL529_31055, partial [Klebsiella pneumoniae]|nr:hypothetical protein [Klebsiella pneumoniae]